MKYGLLGERLSYSYSPLVHEFLCGCEYGLIEVSRNEIGAYMEKRDFEGINVTIPYKKIIFSYMDQISKTAKLTGVINTVVNRGGVLYGDNTDYYGFEYNLASNGIDLNGQNVCIIGSGGTSATIQAVAAQKNAADIYVLTHNSLKNGLSKNDIEKVKQCDVLINASPCGTSPNTDNAPTGISLFENLKAFVDVIYNPYNTKLMQEAKRAGLKTANGLKMLVAQAKKSQELFKQTTLPDCLIDEVAAKIRRKMANIVLIGMPASGKTTIGKALAFEQGVKLIDTDELISLNMQRTVKQIFDIYGEVEFRAREVEAIKTLEDIHGAIIATGGGSILDSTNYDSLSKNGIIVFLDRKLENLLLDGQTRPLARSAKELENLFYERYKIYKQKCDIIVDNNSTQEQTLDLLEEKLQEYIKNEMKSKL